MALKTENLAIVLTDIVGFTEATVSQSRVANEKLLATHNRILLPIVKRFKGRLIKSIGDALLLVFRSPTDAMLCAMAMQDALFEYNRGAAPEAQIHIRVAASLGEVRVTRNDVFGEAVNTTSRIEGITPADEIYFGEAVYIAMNKAEVPSREVGWKELKGFSAPVRIFHIPRFSTPRLVPQDINGTEDTANFGYPYGGAHLTQAPAGTLPGEGVAAWMGRLVKPAMIGFLFLASIGAAALYYRDYKPASETPPAPNPIAKSPAPPSPAAEAAAPVAKAQTKMRVPGDAKKPAEKVPAAKEEPVSKNPADYANVTQANMAFQAHKLSKEEYDNIVTALKEKKRQESRKVRKDYRERRVTKEQHDQLLLDIERKYQ